MARTRSEPSNPMVVTEEQIQALQARIAELKQNLCQQLPQQSAGIRFQAGKPSMFDGTCDDQKVFNWLNKMDVQLELNVMSSGRDLNEHEKIVIVISCLDDTPHRQYVIKVTNDGPFDTYESFRTWIRQFYCPPDVLARYRRQYKNMKQRPDESLEHYQLRFQELVNRLD